MKTNEILVFISQNGGFDNFNNWNAREIQEWVLNYFNCSKYVALKVANKLT